MSRAARAVRRLRGEAALDRSATLDKDAFFDVVSCWRRRHVIRQVGSLSVGETISLSDLAEGVAFVQYDEFAEIDEVGGERRKTAYIGLLQRHIPVLADHGYLDFDEQSKTVTATERSALAREALLALDRLDVWEGSA